MYHKLNWLTAQLELSTRIKFNITFISGIWIQNSERIWAHIVFVFENFFLFALLRFTYAWPYSHLLYEIFMFLFYCVFHDRFGIPRRCTAPSFRHSKAAWKCTISRFEKWNRRYCIFLVWYFELLTLRKKSVCDDEWFEFSAWLIFFEFSPSFVSRLRTLFSILHVWVILCVVFPLLIVFLSIPGVCRHGQTLLHALGRISRAAMASLTCSPSVSHWSRTHSAGSLCSECEWKWCASRCWW
jgi:hypothetical protein